MQLLHNLMATCDVIGTFQDRAAQHAPQNPALVGDYNLQLTSLCKQWIVLLEEPQLWRCVVQIHPRGVFDNVFGITGKSPVRVLEVEHIGSTKSKTFWLQTRLALEAPMSPMAVLFA